MRYARSYPGPDGESHFEDIQVEFTPVPYVPRSPMVDLSASTAASAATFVHLASDWYGDWYPSPRRQFNVTLSGAIEVRVSDGDVRRFGPGDVWLLEDISGKGHNLRVLDADDWYGMLIPLAD